MENKDQFAQKPAEGQPWDVVIIGSGPAALTAAIYTTRGAASTLILGGEIWGGQLMLTTLVDNFPGFPEGIQGPELMQKMRKQVERFGAKFVEKNAESINFGKSPFEIESGEKKYLAKSVILATGADTKWLGVPGEERLRGKGVSSCAPCDAPFFKDKETIVVGGGDAAMEEALVLSKYATKVTIVHRRDEFKASQAMQKKVFENNKIQILWDTEISEIMGEERLEKVRLKTKSESRQYQKLIEGEIGRFQGKILQDSSSDRLTQGEKWLLWEKPVDGLFVAIGHAPSTKIFIGKVETDEKGYLIKKQEEGYHSLTSIPGVFVAGDVHDYHYKQAITAAGFGCQAGMDALKYLG